MREYQHKPNLIYKKFGKKTIAYHFHFQLLLIASQFNSISNKFTKHRVFKVLCLVWENL